MIGCFIIIAIASLSCVAQEVTVADQDSSQTPIPIWAIAIGGILASIVLVVVGIYLIRYYVRRSGIAATAPDLSFRQDDSTIISLDCEKQMDHKSKLCMVPEISSLPYPPSSSLLLSDKLELSSSEEAAALYQTYLNSFEQQQQQQKNSSTMTATLRNTLRRSMRRQQKPNKAPPTALLQDMFDQHNSNRPPSDDSDRPTSKRSSSAKRPQTGLFEECPPTKTFVEESPLPSIPTPVAAAPIMTTDFSSATATTGVTDTKPSSPIPAEKTTQSQKETIGNNEEVNYDKQLPALQRDSTTEKQQQQQQQQQQPREHEKKEEKEINTHCEMTTSVQSKQLAETLSGDLNTFHPPEGSDFHCPEPRMDELIRSDSLPPLSPTTTVQVESPPSPLSPQTPLPTPAVPSFVSPISSYQTDASTSSPCFVKAVDSTQQRISAISVFQDDCPQVIVESPSLNISQAAVDAGRASLDAWQDESTRRDPEYNDDNDDGQSIASSGIAASITAFSHPQRESVQSISPTPRPTPPASIRNSLVATPRASLLGSMSRMSAAEISMLHGNSSISSNTSHVDTIRRSLQNTWRSSTADFPAPGSAQSTIRDAPMSRLALAAAGTAAGGVGSNGHYRPHMPVFTMADDMDDIVVDAPAPTASFSSSTVNTVVLADEYNPPKAKTTAATVAPAAAVVPSPASIGRANQLTKQQQRKSVQQQQQQQQKSSLAAKASNGNSIPAATATATAVTSKPVAGSGKTATVVGTKGTTASYGTVRGGRRQRGSIPWLPDEAPAPSAKKTPAQLEKDRYLKSSKK